MNYAIEKHLTLFADVPMTGAQGRPKKIMKTTKIIAALAVLALTGSAAIADSQTPTTITNAKGQSIVLNRTNETSIALYATGRGVGESHTTTALTTMTRSNHKEPLITLYKTE